MITEYVKGTPYFSDAGEKIKQQRYLDRDIVTDVLVIGGGIDGSITAYFLGKSGIDSVLIEKSRLGYMNTSCATALLEYQLDDHANDLRKFFTKEELLGIYKLGLRSLSDIDGIMASLGNECRYSKRDTLIYSLKEKDKNALLREYEFRLSGGLPVDFLDESNNPFAFPLKCGIYAPDGGAECNPYLFTKQLLSSAEKSGVRIYENTEAKQIEKTGGSFIVTTSYGITVRCNKIICSTGYNTRLFTSKRLCEKFLSYTIVTNPLPNIAWKNRCLLQDNCDPYHYLRLSPDDRVIIGGEDILFKNDTIIQKKAEEKYKKLLSYLKELFPAFADRTAIDYKFCGAFSATKNNLAVIGESPDKKNLFYNLGYGANGIIYAVYGAQMLINLFEGKTDEFAKFFSPGRTLP